MEKTVISSKDSERKRANSHLPSTIYRWYFAFLRWRKVPTSQLNFMVHWFELVSGMKINWKKSCLVGLNSNLEVYEDISDALDCQIRPLHWLSRCASWWKPKAKRILAFGYCSMQKRLATWKATYLSFGGRIALIKATLSNLPIYYLSIFKIPKNIVQELESLQK